MPHMTPEIQEKLYRETDARFALQTGYRPGKKLDPRDPKDAAFVSTWHDIYDKVRAEWTKGKLVTTYDHPVVVAAIQTAHDLLDHAADHIAAALSTILPDEKASHATAAGAAHAQANAELVKAQGYQPPTVNPKLAQQAASDIHAQLIRHQQEMLARGQHKPDLEFGHATVAPSAPSPDLEIGPVTVTPSVADPAPTPRDALDALQASHAPAIAEAAHNQPPAPDAPRPPPDTRSIGATTIVIGGCIAAIALATLLAPGKQAA